MNEKKENIWLARMTEACEHNYMPRFFDFFDGAMSVVLEEVLSKSGEPYLFWGGVPEADRKMLCIYPDFMDVETLEWPMAAFRFKKDFPLDHRNVLGELMALGINRECLGDIHVGEDEVQVIFSERLQPFFEQNIQKIKGHPVKLTWHSAKGIRCYEQKYKEINLVAASDRIDGMIGKIWGFSRQEALRMITQKRLRLNDREVLKNDQRVTEGDFLSLRGKGKAKIAAIEAQRTKKGNLRMTVLRYV